MRKIWIWVIILGVLPLVVVVLSFFYQKELVEIFTRLGWDKFAGFISGPWWTNSIPALILAWGVGVAIWQINEARKSTNAQIAVELFRELRSDKALEILRYIYSLPPKEDGKHLSTIHKDEITFIIERLDMLGALVANGIVNKKLAIEAFGGATSLKCWYQLKSYIEGVRGRQGLQWGKYTEDFAIRSLKYWENRKARQVLYYRNEGDKPIDLVKELRMKEALRPKPLKKQN